MSVILQRAVEQLCREVDALRARVETLEAPRVEKRASAPFEWSPAVQRLTRAAICIFSASEVDTDAEVLAKMLAADGSVPAGEVLKWLRMVVYRGEGNEAHPLFAYLVNVKPLRFGKKTVARTAATVAQ